MTLGAILLALVLGPRAVAPAAPVASAWFSSGHRIVAGIAEDRLTLRSRRAVLAMIGQGGLKEVADWADEIRASRRETGPLHYVNIPLWADAYYPARDCPGGQCIVGAIEEFRRALAAPETGAGDRADALRFLVHLVGDLHQPLHVSDNSDRGGNRTQVQLNGRGTNLHAAWDGELLEAAYGTEEEHLASLQERIASLDLDSLAAGTVVDWAMEGHAIARDAYLIPRNRQLGQDYLAKHVGEMDLALIKAGVRLAGLLNEALADYRADTTARPQSPRASYSDVEAAAHIGETATVVGYVASVRRVASGNVYINLGSDYPRQTFSGAVLGQHDAALDRLGYLEGRKVGLHGVIRLYRGRPEILISSVDQISVMEK